MIISPKPAFFAVFFAFAKQPILGELHPAESLLPAPVVQSLPKSKQGLMAGAKF